MAENETLRHAGVEIVSESEIASMEGYCEEEFKQKTGKILEQVRSNTDTLVATVQPEEQSEATLEDIFAQLGRKLDNIIGLKS